MMITCVLAPAVYTHAAVIDNLGGPGNIAPLASSIAPSSDGLFQPVTNAIDRKISDKNNYVGNHHFVFGKGNPATLTLVFPESHNLTELGAYIVSDVPVGIDPWLNRESSRVDFEVSTDAGGSWALVAIRLDSQFIIAPEDPTKIWSYTSVQGQWDDVNALRYTFHFGFNPRVGEVIAISPEAIPEPTSVWSLSMLSLLCLRRLGRRR